MTDQKRSRRSGEAADPGGQAGRLLTPARPAPTPAPALRRSHFPGPPAPTLRPRPTPTQTILQAIPDALSQRRPAAAVKRALPEGGAYRRTLDRQELAPLTQRGAMSGKRLRTRRRSQPRVGRDSAGRAGSDVATTDEQRSPGGGRGLHSQGGWRAPATEPSRLRPHEIHHRLWTVHSGLVSPH